MMEDYSETGIKPLTRLCHKRKRKSEKKQEKKQRKTKKVLAFLMNYNIINIHV